MRLREESEKAGLKLNLQEREVRGRFKREGTYVYLWLIQVDVWQKPTQFCKAIILQLKNNKCFKNNFFKNYKFFSLKTTDCFVCPDGVF